MFSYTALLFAASIGINLLAALVIGFSGVRRKKAHLIAIAIGCVLAMLYQYIVWQHHSASVLADSMFWAKLRITAALVWLPVFVLVFALWSRYPRTKIIVGLITCGSALLLFQNWFSDFGLGFTEIPEVTSFQMFGDETVYRLSGQTNSFSPIFYIYASGVLISLMLVVRRLFDIKKYLLASTLLITLLAQTMAGTASYAMQVFDFNFIYLTGFPFTILNLLGCITIAVSLEQRGAALMKVVKKSEELEKVLFTLAKGTEGDDSSQYYQEILTEIQTLSGADMAYLAVIEVVNDKRFFQTKAAIYKQKPISNFSYPFEDVPEEFKSDTDPVVIKSGLMKSFSHLEIVTNIGAEAYVGAPLVSTDSGLEGSIVLFFSRAIEPDDSLIKTLQVFASRAASECLREKAEKDLRLMAYSDFKTQLPNLTSFNEEVKQRALFNDFNKQQSAVIVADIDRFGQLNLQIGFENAEFVLLTIAERLKQYAKDTNHNIYVARTGGDEFGILINEFGADGNAEIQRHWQAISELIHLPIKTEFSEIRINLSAGAVIFPEQTTEQMIASRCAEFAMREAKKAGRNQIKLFDMNILEQIYRKQQLEKSLENALSTKTELFLVYQPKVDGNGKLKGMEALCRWQSEEHGFVSPLEFIEIAEANGQIHRLGLWCFAQVCDQINRWELNGFNLPGRVAINVSSKQLESDRFIDEITETLKYYNISPRQIDLELTESGLLKNVEDSIAKLKALRDLGFSVSLDDFGTGYSSLSYLKDLPLDCIKIDRCFVNEIDSSTSKLVQSVISIGQHMGLDIVAEGVEEAPQVRLLQEMGCRIFQGFYFSKPLPADDVPSFLFKVDKASSATTA